jgi:hypothetical protein
MNCNEYQELDNRERILFIGRLVHLVQNDSDAFIAASSMVRSAEDSGLFERVDFLPEKKNADDLELVRFGQ